ncbi:MAG: MFS transporter [Rhizobacter sp.]|nr:MFS transporter [Rhizobacter sp.]
MIARAWRAAMAGPARLGRPFGLLLASDLLMILALMVGHVTVPWWIAHEGGASHLALYAATMAGVSFFALPLLSPLGDRVSKRLLITAGLAATLVESLSLAMLATLGQYRIEWIVMLGTIQMVAMAVITPVSLSIAAELLPPEQLNEGLGYQRSAQAVGRLVGPVAGGALLAATGTAAALWANAALLVLACVLALRIEVPAATRGVRSAGRWLADLRAGLAAKWHIPTERGWTFVSFLVMIFFVPGIGMLVPLKVQSLGLSGAWLGACEAGLSVGLLAGSLGGSLWVAERVGRFRASTGAILGEGIALALLGWTHRPLLLVVLLTVVGGCVATVQAVGHTHRMLAMPQAFRARMTAVNMMVIQVAAVLGPGLAGVALAAWHVDEVYVACGVGLFVVGLGYRRVPGYRQFLGLSHAEAAGYYGREYPALFGDEAPRARSPRP